MTVDEEKWMLRSGEFYHKLFDQHDPGGTFTTTHPGATVQWLAGAGIYLQEKNLATGIDTSNLRLFRLAATLPIVMVITILIVAIVCLMALLMGWQVAIWSGLLLSLEPYLVGSSQIVHLDMLLALLMISAVLSVLVYLERRSWLWLIITGIFTGLSLATKTLPAIWLVIFFAPFLFYHSVLYRTLGKISAAALWKHVKSASRQWFFIMGIAILSYWLIWPALWVKSDIWTSYQRDTESVVTQEHVTLSETDEPTSPISFYLRTLLGRTSPFVLLLSFGMAILAARVFFSPLVTRHLLGRLSSHSGQASLGQAISLHHLAWLIFYAAGYLIMITLAAKKADRYALPALAVLPLLAGIGLSIAWSLLEEKISSLLQPRMLTALKLILVLALIAQPLLWSPYAIAFNSPLFVGLRPLSQQGWGEGLDAAARWLNTLPIADRLIVASWYPAVVRTYFNGETMSLSSRQDDRVGYVVLYRNMQGRPVSDVANDIWQEYRDKKPVKTIFIGGLPYVWVYEQLGLYYFPKNIGELVNGIEVGQTIIAPSGWNGVEIGFSTFSGRLNTQDVVLLIKESPDAKQPIRTVTVNASEFQDSSW